MDSKRDTSINLYPTSHKGRCELVRYHYLRVMLDLLIGGGKVTESEMDRAVRQYMKQHHEQSYIEALYQLFIRSHSV